VVWSSVSKGDVGQNLAYSELFLLARIGAEQDQLQELHRAIFGAVMQPSAEAGNPVFQRSQFDNVRAYLSDVVLAEERLIKLYDQALRMLPPPRPPHVR
jgi:hypothetical protein